MTRSDTLRLFAAIAACMLVAAVFIGGTRSVTITAASLPWGELAHFAMYFVLTTLVYVASRSLRWAVSLVIAVVIFDELLQSLPIGSNEGIAAWLVDAVGIVLACMVIARTRMPMQQRVVNRL